MKEYVDLKFWKMFSGFITLIALSIIILVAIKIHQNKQVEASSNAASVVVGEE
jgi:uncharacterized protein YpmS